MNGDPQGYSADNPFAPKGQQSGGYSPDNPFAKKRPDPRTTRHDGVPFVNAPRETSDTDSDRAAGTLSSFYQGMTLGAGDKITAGIRTALGAAQRHPVIASMVPGIGMAAAITGRAVGEDVPDYQTALREQRDVLENDRKTRPIRSRLTELAGSIPTLVASGSAAAPIEASVLSRVAPGAARMAVRTAGRIGGGAVVGGTMGGAESIRPDATVSDVAGGAETGAKWGAALAALPAVARAAGVFRDAGLGAIGNVGARGRMAALVEALKGSGEGGAMPRLTLRRDLPPVIPPDAPPPRPPSGGPTQQRTMAEVVEAIKARDPNQSMYDAFSREAQASDELLAKYPNGEVPELPSVVKAVRNRTASGRLQQGATKEQLAKRAKDLGRPVEPVKPPVPKVKDVPPEPDDYSALLKKSIKAKGGEPRYNPSRTAEGALQRDLKSVTDDQLEQEYHALAERLGTEEGQHAAIQESGYRHDYNELPRTEKLGRRGQEDLPDADGMIDAERLAADNKIVSEYNRRTVARQAQEKALKRIEAELVARGKFGGGGGFSPAGGAVPFGVLGLAGASQARKRP